MPEPPSTTTPAQVDATAPATGRIVSIDALRGFDMFWIVGADSLARGIGQVSDSTGAQFFSTQLRHVPWAGFAFYDLIFPLFVFLLGMGVVFSLDKIIAREGMLGAHKRILRRFVLLFLLGAFYDQGFAGLPGESPFSGVLQRLAWCYLLTSLLYCHLKLRGLIVVCVSILVGYWLVLGFVPPPGSDSVDLSSRSGTNLAFYIDEHFLPFKEAGQKWDTEGILSTLPAVASCLLGVFAGLFLLAPGIDPRKKILCFIGAGILLLALGHAWGFWFPVIKRLWTSSYVLVAGGYSLMLVGLFYLVIDHLGYKKWAIPFIWIGVNPLTMYLLDEIVDFQDLGARVAGGPIAALFGNYGQLWVTLVGLLLIVLVARFLYKRGIFLRV